MAEDETRQALAVFWPDESEIRVGNPWHSGGKPVSKDNPPVTAITVSLDLPGPLAWLERIRVWVDDTCVYESPMHMVEGVEYPLEDEGGGSEA